MKLRLLTEDELNLIRLAGLEAIWERKPSFNIINKEQMFLFENEMFTISIVCILNVDINRRGHNPTAIPVSEKKFKFIFWLPLKVNNIEMLLHVRIE